MSDPTVGSPETLPTLPMRRADVAVIERLPGVAALVRDSEMRLRWCNDAFARLCKHTREELMLTTPHEWVPKAAADERCETMRNVLRTGRAARYIQFGADKRLLCTLTPVDEADWGFAGVFATVQEAPCGSGLEDGEPVEVLRTPLLDGLSVLSPRELEVLYYVGRGMSTPEVGALMHRSAKTVEKHLESVHRKLGTKSRAELVRLAVERGLQAFTEAEWSQIVVGSRQTRRAARPA